MRNTFDPIDAGASEAPEDTQEGEGTLWPEGFRLDSEEAAEWVVDKLLTYEERLARLDRQYKRTRAALVREKESFSARFLVPLQVWAGHQLGRGSRTVHLLAGSLSFRRVKGGPKVLDADAVLRWADEALPEAVVEQVTRRIDAQALREYVLREGEIPPGVSLIEDHDAFYVRAPKAQEVE
jgi:hypothetical protein